MPAWIGAWSHSGLSGVVDCRAVNAVSLLGSGPGRGQVLDGCERQTRVRPGREPQPMGPDSRRDRHRRLAIGSARGLLAQPSPEQGQGQILDHGASPHEAVSA